MPNSWPKMCLTCRVDMDCRGRLRQQTTLGNANIWVCPDPACGLLYSERDGYFEIDVTGAFVFCPDTPKCDSGWPLHIAQVSREDEVLWKCPDPEDNCPCPWAQSEVPLPAPEVKAGAR